jgi:hypothetical protein
MSKKNRNNRESRDITMDAVKAFEASLKQAAKEPESETLSDNTVSYDEWWATRNQMLKQPQHIKEILLKDARARGLDKMETMDRWDWAARTYGLKF